jgi:hypothetical protein
MRIIDPLKIIILLKYNNHLPNKNR